MNPSQLEPGQNSSILGLALVDKQLGSSFTAIWLVGCGDGFKAAPTNAVVLDNTHPNAQTKFMSLIADRVVGLTNGSTLTNAKPYPCTLLDVDADSVSASGEGSIEDLVSVFTPDEFDNFMFSATLQVADQVCAAVDSYAERTKNRTLVRPYVAAPERWQVANSSLGISESECVQRVLDLCQHSIALWNYWLAWQRERTNSTRQKWPEFQTPFLSLPVQNFPDLQTTQSLFSN